jgi:hypothetical protein
VIERVEDCRALDEAQAHIRDIDAAGELPLAVRRRLRESLVALLPGDGRALTFAAVLGLACAKRAWPVRREFWHWYLTTAMPAAFTAAVEC